MFKAITIPSNPNPFLLLDEGNLNGQNIGEYAIEVIGEEYRYLKLDFG